MQYTVIQKIHTFTYIHKNESKHSEMGPVKQNPMFWIPLDKNSGQEYSTGMLVRPQVTRPRPENSRPRTNITGTVAPFLTASQHTVANGSAFLCHPIDTCNQLFYHSVLWNTVTTWDVVIVWETSNTADAEAYSVQHV